MDKWVEQLAKALELPAAVDVDTMLDVARDVARFFGREMTGSVYRTGPIPEPAPVAAERA